MWVADRVDEALEVYREAHGIARPWETRERVVVAITGAPGGDDVDPAGGPHGGAHAGRAARCARAAGRRAARPTGRVARASSARLLQELGGEYHELASADVATALVQFARVENATQIVLGASRQSRWTHFLRGSVINDVIRASGAIDIHVISSEDDSTREHAEPTDAGDGTRPPTTRCRGVAAGAGCSPGSWRSSLPPLLTLVLANVRETLTLPSDLLIFLMVVVVVAALGGFAPAAVSAITGFLLANWYFTPPFYRFTISEGENLLALGDLPPRRRSGEHARRRRVAPHGRGGPGARGGRDPRRAQRHAWPRRTTRSRDSWANCGWRSRPTGWPCSPAPPTAVRGRCSPAPVTPCRSIPTTPTSSSRCTAPRCSP